MHISSSGKLGHILSQELLPLLHCLSPPPTKDSFLSFPDMALKRKLDLDSFEDFPQVCPSPDLLCLRISITCQTAKQLKLVPFPGYEPDHDVAMSDSSSSDTEQFSPESHHARLVSTTSTASSLSEAVDYSSRKFLYFLLPPRVRC